MVLLHALLYFVLGFISALIFIAVTEKIQGSELDDDDFPYAGMIVIAWPFLDFILLVVLSFYLSGRALEYVYKRIRK